MFTNVWALWQQTLKCLKIFWQPCWSNNLHYRVNFDVRPNHSRVTVVAAFQNIVENKIFKILGGPVNFRKKNKCRLIFYSNHPKHIENISIMDHFGNIRDSILRFFKVKVFFVRVTRKSWQNDLKFNTI
jgi:hypothetical protein